jgi:pimeloyl-ACP methyl ester carboxylesterase
MRAVDPEWGSHADPMATAPALSLVPRATAPMLPVRPVVFLPGLLCDQRLWRDQIDDLADIVAPFVADLTLDDDVSRMAARVLAVAPPRFALVGLSMGGYVALEIMRQAPERVERLALIDTSARADSAERAEERRRGMASLQRGRFVGITGPLLRQLIHESRVAGPVGDQLKAMAARVGGAAFLRQQKAILNRPDSRPDLSAITVPTMIAVGDDDRVTPPEHAIEMHERIAGSTLHMLGDCGHLPALERPEEISRLLRDWLTEAHH